MATANKILLDEYKILLDIQLSDGNWDADQYMHGMANGMILMDSIARGTDPEFLDAPKYWRKRIPRTIQQIKYIWPIYKLVLVKIISRITDLKFINVDYMSGKTPETAK